MIERTLTNGHLTEVLKRMLAQQLLFPEPGFPTFPNNGLETRAGVRRIRIQDLLNPVLPEQVSIASGALLAPKEAQVLAQLAP